MSEELNKKEVGVEKKFKKNKCLKLISISIIIFVLILLVYNVFFCGKLIIEPALEPIEEIGIGKVEFTTECKKELNNRQRQLADVYKIENAGISKKVQSNIEKYANNPELNVIVIDNDIIVDNNSDYEGVSILTEEQKNNPKEEFKEELEKILKLLDVEDKFDVDDFETDLKYADNGVDYIEVDFESTKLVTSKYNYIGHPAELCITLGKDNNLRFLSYTNYDMKKIGKKYNFKTRSSIAADIKTNNNIFVEVTGGSGDYKGTDGNDLVIDSVEVVYDYPHYVDDYKYIIPYYVLSGKNKKGESIQITMPAIKNKYLLVK